jgi:hypothetical protein
MDQPSIYRIRVEGHLDTAWSDWFEGFAFTHEPNGETTLSGPIVDQSALQGVLLKLSSLNVSIVAVNRVEPGAEENPSTP